MTSIATEIPKAPRMTPRVAGDLDIQARILPDVSRTFALTIPQLPDALEVVVANAYLLCRIVDTIEDDPDLNASTKAAYLAEFLAVLEGEADAADFATRLAERLSDGTKPGERDLIENTPAVVRITAAFSPTQRQALNRCVEKMAMGMAEFQRNKTLDGLPTLLDLDRYCYFVAGIVGEMLTDLFCEYCPELEPKRDEMMALAVCFGQGLQMTNILKDIWEDRESNTCWLPRSVFDNLDGGLSGALERQDGHALAPGIEELVGIAHAHLQSALRYTQIIPKHETGLRRFCLWAIGMALLTLRSIHNNPGYRHGGDVKISRRAVRATIIACNVAQASNRVTQALFDTASRGLPLASGDNFCPPPGALTASDRLA
ncbi:MAG: phytoene/squalene synthase family protein [Gammaproteobacteria bacterium]